MSGRVRVGAGFPHLEGLTMTVVELRDVLSRLNAGVGIGEGLPKDTPVAVFGVDDTGAAGYWTAKAEYTRLPSVQEGGAGDCHGKWAVVLTPYFQASLTPSLSGADMAQALKDCEENRKQVQLRAGKPPVTGVRNRSREA